MLRKVEARGRLETATSRNPRCVARSQLSIQSEGVRWLLFLFALIPLPARAETWTGVPQIIDGDSLVIAGQGMRLHNVDAFETEQFCTRDGQEYRCGLEATFALIGLVQDREVSCEGRIRDQYGRVLAKCRAGGIDLGSAMVRSGWAMAEWRAEYRPDQEHAKQARLGAWAGTFQRPKDWRRDRRNASSGDGQLPVEKSEMRQVRESGR